MPTANQNSSFEKKEAANNTVVVEIWLIPKSNTIFITMLFFSSKKIVLLLLYEKCLHMPFRGRISTYAPLCLQMWELSKYYSIHSNLKQSFLLEEKYFLIVNFSKYWWGSIFLVLLTKDLVLTWLRTNVNVASAAALFPSSHNC